MNRRFQLFCLLLPLLFAGCVKEVKQTQPRVPPNVRAYYGDFRTLWFTLTAIITREYGLPLSVAEYRDHYFATKTVYESTDFVKTRYHLTGSVKFDGEKHVISLYRHTEVFDGRRWSAVLTDFSLEQAILNRLSEKLEAKAKAQQKRRR